jgi:hypothetical protein
MVADIEHIDNVIVGWRQDFIYQRQRSIAGAGNGTKNAPAREKISI